MDGCFIGARYCSRWYFHRDCDIGIRPKFRYKHVFIEEKGRALWYAAA